ncbi:MAG: hypothetical protein QM768_04845 [Agriterribacter sp.]
MKYLYLLLLTAGLNACSSSNKLNSNTLRGKLVVSELCAHYVVAVVSGNIDASKTATDWKDEKRNQTFKQSFSVANRCSFGKEDIKEGDEFTFEIDNAPQQENCAVCMAYYPTPSQSLHIKNVNKIQP